MATKAPAKKAAARKKTAAKKPAEEKADSVIAPQRKRLEDLYVFGKEVEVKDPEGNFEKVWIQKLSPTEEKDALRPARALRSQISMVKRLPHDHPDFLDYMYLLEDYGVSSREDQATLVMQQKLEETRASIELRVAGEDKWAEEDYLIGLQEAWVDGLRERYILNPEDEEAKKVFKVLQEYTDEVMDEFGPERDGLLSEFDHLSDEELREKATETFIDREAQSEMMEEFRHQRVYLATRDADNHDELYFSSVDAVRRLDRENVFNKLEDALEDVTVGIMEGKD